MRAVRASPRLSASFRETLQCAASPAGLKSTYTYAAVFSKVQGKFSGIAKFDLGATNGGAVVGQIEHGSERYGGEAVFVKGSGPGKLSHHLSEHVHIDTPPAVWMQEVALKCSFWLLEDTLVLLQEAASKSCGHNCELCLLWAFCIRL